jgi:nitrogen fixation/metabolism regulation signal transduction histidine kinase
VLTNVINIFTLIFIIFLVGSYYASNKLTFPLKYITQKLKRTSLSDYNEPLSWNSDDEIGLMISEYNRMLVKLESSKEALSRSEKESAWREMAKQVAHEIKNPLTPMKLSLQHMKRVLEKAYALTGNGDSEEKDATIKPIDNLLDQVDTLNEIATSFSSFAQMPMPKSEYFDLAPVVKRTVELFQDGQHSIELQIEKGGFGVVSDSHLMSRIISNLIINAKQSVPQGRKPKIQVSLQKGVRGFLILKVSDNGSGISKEIQDKVFLPNFSTKYTGSGIGLAIAKRGIEHSGGRITFETKENIGTTFYIELPLAFNV